MPTECNVHRYTAYFRGWATAFGSHEKEIDEERALVWLFGEDQVGLILSPTVKRFLYPLLLGKGKSEPIVSLTEGRLRIQDTEIALADKDQRPYEAVMGLVCQGGDPHLFQSYHLVYPSGTRILTLARKAPLGLIYSEIRPLILKLS